MSDKKLKIVAVGGAGAMGRHAMRTLARLGTADLLAIADIDVGRARRLADEIGEPALSLELDATDPVAMRTTFEDYEVVINTMGPFAKFARPILAAAIQSRCHYFDIGDDWQSTVDAYEFDARARAEDLHVVIGLGGSPGTTNLCAVIAHSRLDRVDDLFTGWKLSAAVTVDEPDYPTTGNHSAAVEHWLLQCSGTIRTWDKGSLVDSEPLQPVELDFPGIGPAVAYTMGHPEPVTLPRYFPDVKRSVNLQSGPEWIVEYLRSVATRYDRGEVTLREGAALLADPPRPAERGARDLLPVIWALAVGTKDGRPASVAVSPTTHPAGAMGGNTGLPLAIGVELLRRGQLRDVGVHAPEAAIDPAQFFDLLGPLTEPGLTGANLLAIDETVR
jgi:saccharopine dehydrogenase-like NADP-dependent oxidoreductase